MKDAAAALSPRRSCPKEDEQHGWRRRGSRAISAPGRLHVAQRGDDSIIGWSEDGTQILRKETDRFAAEVCPKFFRHRNFNSFTRLLNMYQFHKVPVFKVIPRTSASSTPTFKEVETTNGGPECSKEGGCPNRERCAHGPRDVRAAAVPGSCRRRRAFRGRLSWTRPRRN